MQGRLTIAQLAAIAGLPVSEAHARLIAGTPPAPRIVDPSGVSWFTEEAARFSLGFKRAEWQGLMADFEIRRLSA